MSELAIQKWLRARSALPDAEFALTELEAAYAIKSRRHGLYDNLVLLKYDQINSPFREELVQDCRGIILDEDDDWKVVCLTYRKFFNYGESLAAEIDWPSAVVMEKLDGSLIQLYFYEGEWHVATSGTPDGNTPVGDFKKTFAELFWETAKPDLRQRLNQEQCYAFELCTPLNRVVVRHTTPTIYLHGARNIASASLTEVAANIEAIFLGVEIPRRFPLASYEDCQKAAAVLDPLAHEGYVVLDRWANRVKIKSPNYVALHHAKDGLLSRRMLANVIRSGEGEELKTALQAFPELANEFKALQDAHEVLVVETMDAYIGLILELGDCDQKTFALRAKTARCSGALFTMRKNKVPANDNTEAVVRKYLAEVSEPAYERLIENAAA